MVDCAREGGGVGSLLLVLVFVAILLKSSKANPGALSFIPRSLTFRLGGGRVGKGGVGFDSFEFEGEGILSLELLLLFDVTVKFLFRVDCVNKSSFFVFETTSCVAARSLEVRRSREDRFFPPPVLLEFELFCFFGGGGCVVVVVVEVCVVSCGVESLEKDSNSVLSITMLLSVVLLNSSISFERSVPVFVC